MLLRFCMAFLVMLPFIIPMFIMVFISGFISMVMITFTVPIIISSLVSFLFRGLFYSKPPLPPSFVAHQVIPNSVNEKAPQTEVRLQSKRALPSFIFVYSSALVQCCVERNKKVVNLLLYWFPGKISRKKEKESYLSIWLNIQTQWKKKIKNRNKISRTH